MPKQHHRLNRIKQQIDRIDADHTSSRRRADESRRIIAERLAKLTAAREAAGVPAIELSAGECEAMRQQLTAYAQKLAAKMPRYSSQWWKGR